VKQGVIARAPIGSLFFRKFFRSKQKNQENKQGDCVRSHTMLRMWNGQNRLARNKREDSIDFKSMLQVLDHDPDTQIQQKVNVSTTSRESLLNTVVVDVMF
jgi:hypothetical protein